MKSYLLICFVPTVFTSIDLYISGSFHANFTIQASGSDKAIITESERLSFNISDKIIKDCVDKYIGRRPDDAFFHRPTPWGDLYRRYGWTETYRVLRPVSSRIVSIASSPQMLIQDFFETNKTSVIQLSQTIFNRFSTTWITNTELSVRINFYIDVDNFKTSNESALGVNGVKLEAIAVGITFSQSLDSDFVVVELYATRVLMKAEVLYQASLWGNAVVNYDRAFRGHHFYSPNLEDLMYICGLPNSLQLKELIHVGFYTDAKVVVKNKSSGLMILTENVKIHPL